MKKRKTCLRTARSGSLGLPASVSTRGVGIYCKDKALILITSRPALIHKHMMLFKITFITGLIIILYTITLYGFK